MAGKIMQKKVHVEVWGGIHNQPKKIPMMIDPTLITKEREIDFKNMTDFQRRKIFKHVCNDRKCECYSNLRNVQFVLTY